MKSIFLTGLIALSSVASMAFEFKFTNKADLPVHVRVLQHGNNLVFPGADADGWNFVKSKQVVDHLVGRADTVTVEINYCPSATSLVTTGEKETSMGTKKITVPCSDLKNRKEADFTLPKQTRAEINLGKKADKIIIHWDGKSIVVDNKAQKNITKKDIIKLDY